MEKSHEKLECKASETVPSNDPNTFLKPWLKPTFEREVMKDALSGGGNLSNMDGPITCAS